MNGDPEKVLEVLRDVLLKSMDHPDALLAFRVQSAVSADKDSPAGLLLTMRSGHKYRLTLTEEKGAAETIRGH